jgi:hypothetical protein
MRTGIASCILFGLILGLATILGVGCAGVVRPPEHFSYFSIPDPSDPWSPKISGWQRRERADDGSDAIGLDRLAPVAGPGDDRGVTPVDTETTNLLPDSDLRGKYFDFRADRRRGLARELAEWIQSEARSHYVEDGPIDHWATLEETLRSNGDDCDGLELLVYHALRDLGFEESEVYRSIVYRPSDGQHHMVTLWFEDPNDPWVIDPTGAMTRGMPRMSDMPEWVPLKVFSETMEYTVRSGSLANDDTTLASHR